MKAARMTAARLASGSAFLLVAALAAVAPAQNRFDLAPASPAATPSPAPASTSPAEHRNVFAVQAPRAAVPVASAVPSATAGTANPPSSSASAARTHALEAAPAPAAATAPAETATRAAPVLLAASWSGRTIRLAPSAPAGANDRAGAAATAGKTSPEPAPAATAQVGRNRNETPSAAPTSTHKDDGAGTRLNYWDRERWDPWYLNAWVGQLAPYGHPDHGRRPGRGPAPRRPARN
ncbi:MAG: hypothetical protein JXQ29_16890 [Planctomycetes bacterium]|nr:hypothetical protein [Planctomycetota bacterium]